MSDATPIRVMALHALAYCERLFYLEEVEEIRGADARVFDGRRLHEALDEEGELVTMQLESATIGIKGKLDALRRRDGALVPYEHKKGRARKGEGGPEAWPSDRLQIGAYALLLEEATGEAILEGRIRYHADNRTVRVPIDESTRQDVRTAVERSRILAAGTIRPPVTSNESLCGRCSLAPVCLPEETRKAETATHTATRLFPANDERGSRQQPHVLPRLRGAAPVPDRHSGEGRHYDPREAGATSPTAVGGSRLRRVRRSPRRRHRARLLPGGDRRRKSCDARGPRPQRAT